MGDLVGEVTGVAARGIGEHIAKSSKKRGKWSSNNSVPTPNPGTGSPRNKREDSPLRMRCSSQEQGGS
jgi:hypothetical protein